MHGQNLRYKYATETLRDSEIRSILNEYVLVSTLLACVTCMMKIARTSYLKFVPYNPKPKSTKYNTPWRNSSSQLPVVSRSTRSYDNSCMTVYLRSSDWVDGNCLDYRLFWTLPDKNDLEDTAQKTKSSKTRIFSFPQGIIWILRASEFVSWFFQYNNLQHRGKKYVFQVRTHIVLQLLMRTYHVHYEFVTADIAAATLTDQTAYHAKHVRLSRSLH